MGELVEVTRGEFRVRHEADSPTMTSIIATDVFDELFEQCPWIVDLDKRGVEQYCRAEARARLLQNAIDTISADRGVTQVPAHILRECTSAERNAMQAAAALGLTPASRIPLERDRALARAGNVAAVGGIERIQERGAACRAERA